MMSAKAKLFSDFESFDKIMKSDDPREQKALGRKVKNFNYETWMEYAVKIVTVGNMMKYDHSIELFKWLTKIKSEYIYMVEASPYDKIWGIGLRSNDMLCRDKKTWKGQNLLGQCIDDAYDNINTLCFVNDTEKHQKVQDLWSLVKEIFNNNS